MGDILEQTFNCVRSVLSVRRIPRIQQLLPTQGPRLPRTDGVLQGDGLCHTEVNGQTQDRQPYILRNSEKKINHFTIVY